MQHCFPNYPHASDLFVFCPLSLLLPGTDLPEESGTSGWELLASPVCHVVACVSYLGTNHCTYYLNEKQGEKNAAPVVAWQYNSTVSTPPEAWNRANVRTAGAGNQ